MEHQFATRSTQAVSQPQQQHQQSQHIYSAPAYNVYQSQPGYLAGAYQPNSQSHPITYAPTANPYPRSVVSNNYTNAPPRRGGNMIGANGGMNRGSSVHQGGVASSSISHQLAGNANNHHSVISAPLPTTIASHQRIVSQDMPLLMMVDAKYVGAIIGQGGSNIREITKESKARCVVDVNRTLRDNVGNTEKVISITGQPENCSKACVKILEVVRKEKEKDTSTNQRSEIELKLRVHNQLVGRLIGRNGATIKKIMEDTGAVVFVSNEQTLSREMVGLLPQFGGPSSLYSPEVMSHMERTVTIKASDIDTASAAEQKISQKLRQSYEMDVGSRFLHSSNTLPLMAPIGNDPSTYLNLGLAASPSHLNHFQNPHLSTFSQRTVRMWVPNNMVGALIGAKGVHIRNMMRMTGVHISIEGGRGTSGERAEKNNGKSDEKQHSSDGNNSDEKKSEISTTGDTIKISEGSEERKIEEEGDGKIISCKQSERDGGLHAHERLVTIVGNEMQQHKTQFWIYQRVSEQNYRYLDEIRLCTEIEVPSRVVGRIIGKGGQNVRELQRLTGAQVKIPDDGGDETKETATVRILGNFQGSNSVQNRLLHLINEFNSRVMNGQNTSVIRASKASAGQERASSRGQAGNA